MKDPTFDELQAWCLANWLQDLTDDQAMRAWKAAHAEALSAVAPPPVLEDAWKPSGVEYDRSIHHNPDASAWADFFVATFPGQVAQHDLMRGWFANAMMAMHDWLKTQAASPAAPAQPESGDWKAELHEALSEEYSDTRPAPAQQAVTDGRPSDAAIARAFWDRWTSTAIHVEAAHELQRIHTAARASNAAASAADAQEGK